MHPGSPVKLNDGIEKYNAFHDDWDKQNVVTHLVHSERAKKNGPKKGTTAMNWFLHGLEDTDEKYKHGGIDNDELYHEPPDKGFGPVIDHKLDERILFDFRKTPYGTEVIDNMWDIDPDRALTDTGAPWWFPKIYAPDYFNEEMAQEFLAQMYNRREFDLLKLKWA